jgi:hypothetical protein
MRRLDVDILMLLLLGLIAFLPLISNVGGGGFGDKNPWDCVGGGGGADVGGCFGAVWIGGTLWAGFFFSVAGTGGGGVDD